VYKSRADTASRFLPGSRFGTVTQLGVVFYLWHGGTSPKRRAHCVVRCDCGVVLPVLCLNLNDMLGCRKCVNSAKKYKLAKQGWTRHPLYRLLEPHA
jgi:hypothetical protein